MTESIGTARLDVVVETTGMTAGVQTVKNSISGLSADAQRQFDAMTKAQQRTALGFASFGQNAGKSREELKALSAEMRIGGPLGKQLAENIRAAGLAARQASGDIKSFTLSPSQLFAANRGLTEFRKGLADNKTAALGAAGALNQYGISAKQQAAALRGVPAQITDIFTSLASGQRPITVLLQQGGQLKDMFGGVVPAARALGGAIAGLVNPFTVAAAAIVGLGVAFNKVSEEQAAFDKALVLSGNVANVTTGQLEALANQLDETTNASGAKAREVLAQVAASGKFTAEQFDLVARAAINMEEATGQSVEKTVQQFAELKKDPVEAILKLNEAVGDGTNITNFLTQAQIDAIEKFKEQGKSADAARVAVEAYADAINTRAPQVVQNLGLFASTWRVIKREAADAADAVLGVFRDIDREGALLLRNPVFSRLLVGASILPGAGFLRDVVAEANKPLEPILIGFKRNPRPVDSAQEREAIAFKDKYLSKEEEKKKAIAELDRLRSHYTKEEYDILKKGIDERFKPPKGPKSQAGAIESATSRAAIQALEDQLKKEQGLLANQKQLLEANYAARNVTAEKYYAEQKRLAQENTAAQERALEGEIAALQARSLKGKDSINNTREMAEKEALLAKVRADGAAQLEVLNIQEAAQIKQRQQANLAYQDALDQGREALKAELDSQVLRITVGEREFEIRSRIIQLYRDEAKELLNLARQRDAGEIDPATYEARVEQLRKSIAEEVQIVRDGYDAMAAAQKNWANGALKAFADYSDAANDVAGQTYTIFSDALRGLEDVFVDFFTKGKADWKGFFDSIIAETIRFGVRQQLNNVIKKFLPGMGGEQDSAQALSGAAASLAASATPLYGAAAALSASATALAAATGAQATTGSTQGNTGFIANLLGMFTQGGTTTDGWFGFWKNGGAFANGAPVEYFARGDVFDRPTAFNTGRGMGVMGEAGPEAIMPLKRGSDGKLGVAVNNDAAPRRGDVIQHNTYNIAGPMSRTAREAARYDNARNLNRAQRRNG